MTLYVDSKAVNLSARGETIEIVERAGVTRSLPLRLLDRVVIQPGSRISATLISKLGGHGIALVIVNPRRLEQSLRLHPLPASDVSRRLAQYELFHNENWRSAWSRRIVDAKLKGQQLTLHRAARVRQGITHEVGEACRSITVFRRKLREEPPPRPASIVGLEGAAAAAYFRAYSLLFPPSLKMTGRNRRPPRDPVNVCLSLSYTIVHAQLVTDLIARGLDPYLGFYHEPAPGRESLASDLIEIVRPRVDDWVWEMFRERRLRPEHFHFRARRCLMGKAGRRIFYEELEQLMDTLERLTRRLARLTVRAVTAASVPSAQLRQQGVDNEKQTALH